MNFRTIAFVEPDWPAPRGVKAVTTTRAGGISRPPYAALNLGDHVGDSEAAVRANRKTLQQRLALPRAPCWLTQVHGDTVVDAGADVGDRRADGCFTRSPGRVCVVLTADCLPVLLCDTSGRCVAALHAGWRGLAAGIIAAGVRAMASPTGDLMAWLGPAIGPAAFEVGAEVRDVFVNRDPDHARAFVPRGDRWLADLYLLARQQLGALGVKAVYGGGWCTWNDRERFYSYRRDGTTGRMATLIWREGQ